LDDFRFLVTDKEDGLVVQVFGGGDNFAGFGLTTLKEKGTTLRRRSAFRLMALPPKR
jgi:predicted alternative tryptophan synthase beta-subunit